MSKLTITTIKVDNLKCGGCANTVEKGLLSVPGIEKAEVHVEQDEVVVHCGENTDMNAVKEKLRHMGYPETGSTEGFEKFARNVQSYVSCAIGRLGPKKEEAA